MSAPKDGGPAFPAQGIVGLQISRNEKDGPTSYGIIHDAGLTVRQWYKGMAISAAMEKGSILSLSGVAVMAAKLADMLLEEDAQFAEKEKKDEES